MTEVKNHCPEDCVSALKFSGIDDTERARYAVNDSRYCFCDCGEIETYMLIWPPDSLSSAFQHNFVQQYLAGKEEGAGYRNSSSVPTKKSAERKEANYWLSSFLIALIRLFSPSG